MADQVCRKLGKKRWVRSEAGGFSGGVWIFWDEDEVRVKVVEV